MLSPILFLETSSTHFPTGQFQNYLSKSADPIGEKHKVQSIRLQILQKHNPVQPLGRLNLPSPMPNKTEKHKQWIEFTIKMGVEWNTEPASENGGGSSCRIKQVKAGQGTMTESLGGARSQPPKGAKILVSRRGVRHKGWEQRWSNKPNLQSRGWGAWWITEIVSWTWGDLKLSCPTLLGEELTRHSCSGRAKQKSCK
jgi:hypothetical protein